MTTATLTFTEPQVIDNGSRIALANPRYFAKLVDGNPNILAALKDNLLSQEDEGALVDRVSRLAQDVYDTLKDSPLAYGTHALLGYDTFVVRVPEGKARYMIHSRGMLIQLNIESHLNPNFKPKPR